MRRIWIVGMLALLLSGCGGQETMETIADDLVAPVMARPRQIAVRLPEDAIAPVLEGEGCQIYMSEEYEIAIETMASGDLRSTIEKISGYDRESLTVMETKQEDAERYEFVWVSTGERGDLLGRAVILDDGQYHYCMSVLRDASSVENTQIVWSDVFGSFTLT
ncbi:MAG: hypothetical protein IKJ84_05550 [Oscillospiraceae bacterium]|nr:hypothetical protein [Oscillospiraceae bacterium]